MTTTLSLPAPAKLNLFLHITGRRADGYHELQTAFQFLDFGDTLHFTPCVAPRTARHGPARVTVTPDIPGVAPEDNLIVRAAEALRRYLRGPEPDILIRVDKRLPMGGGLGGGSSNAATALLALNRLWQLDLGLDTLAEIGLRLGADVPVFVRGRAAWAEGIGERLTAIDIAEDWYLVLVPDCSVSTPKIFQDQRLTRNSKPIRIAPAFDGNSPGYRNDCEAVVCALYPEVKAAMQWLGTRSGNARLTGTGACIFSRFPAEFGAREVLIRKPSGVGGFIAKGLNVSPLHKQLFELS